MGVSYLQTRAQFRPQQGSVSVTDVGADPNGGADSTAAFNRALLASTGVFVPPGTYRIDGTVLVPSLTTLWGTEKGATKLQATANLPIVASRNYYAATGASTSGRCVIKGMTLIGTANAAHTAQHGIILRDYYSELSDLSIEDTGGSAILITHLNDAAAAVGGTLVENRIANIACRSILGAVCMQLGPDNNAKMTDGTLRDINLQHAGDASQIGIYIGSAAGWSVSGVHTYGSNVLAEAVKMRFSDRCTVQDVYVEHYLTNALLVHAVSGAGGIAIDDIRALAADAAHDSRVVQCEAGSGNPVYNVGKVGVHKSATGNSTRAIGAAGGAYVYSVQPPIKSGSNLSTITSYHVSSGSFMEGYRGTILADAGNAAYAGLNAVTTSDVGVVVYNTVITADRAVALPTVGLYAGLRYRVIRTAAATGAFAVNIGTGPVKALSAAGTWADLLYTGTAWIIEAAGED